MRYVNGPTSLMQFIIEGLFPAGGDQAMDLTMGNGLDTLFLAQRFRQVTAIEIQAEAVARFRPPANVTVLNMDHSKIEGLNIEPEVAVYNLGYLPGHDQGIRTRAETTIRSLEIILQRLKIGGFVLAALYYGHDQGEEGKAVLDYLSRLPGRFGVIHHQFINRTNYPPSLVVIEKR